MSKAIYPGSFDPVHNGHVDIATRASKLLDELIVCIYDAPPNKSLMFTTEERVEFFHKSVAHLPNVKVIPFTGLAPTVARQAGADYIIRGLRAGVDFDLEFEMALMWHNIASDIDVICLMSSLEHQFLHSSRIKEVVSLGASIDNLVPSHVAAALNEKVTSLESAPG